MFADSIERRKLAVFLRECVGKEMELEFVLKRLGMLWLAYCYPRKIAEDEKAEEENEVLLQIEVGMNALATP